MRTLVLVVLLVSVLALPAFAYDWVTNPSNGHRYAIVPAGIDWNEAEANAIAAGGHLVSIGDAQENAWVLALQRTHFAYFMWIGLYQIEGSPEPSGTWAWSSGESVTYMNWSPGEPSDGDGLEDWVAMDGYGRWVDLMNTWPPGSGYDHIAMVEVVPEPSSLLALGSLVAPLGFLIRRRKG